MPISYTEGHFQLFDPIAKWMPEFSEMQVAVPTHGEGIGLSYRLEPAKVYEESSPDNPDDMSNIAVFEVL